MKIWVTTDWHLWSVEDRRHPYKGDTKLNEWYTKFCEKLSDDDVVLILGDLCDPQKADLKKLEEMIRNMPGYKMLCLGNHDELSKGQYLDMGFDSVSDGVVCDSILFTHKPVYVDEYVINIHGHLHTRMMINDWSNRHINAYRADCMPTELNDLLTDATYRRADTNRVFDRADLRWTEKEFSTLDKEYISDIVDISEFVKNGIDGHPMDESAEEKDEPTEKLVIPVFEDIYKFSAWMKANIHYKNFDKLQRPVDTVRTKRGSCHDQVILEYQVLREMNYVPKILFFIEYADGNDVGGRTHTTIFCTNNNDKRDKSVYWFENAWSKEAGVKKFNSIDEIKDAIEKAHANEPEAQKYPNLEFKLVSPSKMVIGSDLRTLVGSIINESSEAPVEDDAEDDDIDDVKNYFDTTDKYRVVNESVTKKDDYTEFNFSNWSIDTGHNALYITGLSGSGKTTLGNKLAAQYNATYVNLDHFMSVCRKGSKHLAKRITDGNWTDIDIYIRYFKEHPDGYIPGGYTKTSLSDISRDVVGKYYLKFSKWFRELIHTPEYSRTLFVVEGVHIYEFESAELYRDEPVIVMSAGTIKALFRRERRGIGRIKEQKPDIGAIELILGTIKDSVTFAIPMYLKQEHVINKFRSDMTSISESINLFESAYTFELADKHEKLFFPDTLNEASSDTKLYPVYIMLMHSGTTLANLIKKVTKSNFSHSSISFDSSMTKMYSFGRKFDSNPFIGTFKSENIRTKFFEGKDIPYALYMVPATKNEIDAMKRRLEFFTKNATKFKYDFVGLFKNYFGIADNPEYRYFCSRFVADIINAGRPAEKPYVVEPSLMKPEDFAHTTFAQYVTGGSLDMYDPMAVDGITKRMLREEEIRRIMLRKVDESVTRNLPNSYATSAILAYECSIMDEAAFDKFIDYIKSFKIKFNKSGDVIITRREYENLEHHFKQSLKTIKAMESAGNVEGVKNELCKIHYMNNLISEHYLTAKYKQPANSSIDIRKKMIDLRSVMLNAFKQHLTYVTVREPRFNFQEYYNNSDYGRNFTVPKNVVSNIGKTIVTLLK